MKSLWMRRISWFAIFLIIVFLAADIEARRGGGGGGRGGGGFSRGGGGRSMGGGSRSFSRSSPARSGSLGSGYSRTSGSGSYSRNSPARSGSLGSSRGSYGSRSTFGGSRQASRTERQGTRQETRTGRQENRQETRTERQENRQGYREEAREDWQEYGDGDDWGEWHGGEWYGGEAWEYVGAAAALTVGTALTVGAINSLSCAMSRVYVEGVSYYSCGGYWYNRGYQDGNVVYVVVNPPSGY